MSKTSLIQARKDRELRAELEGAKDVQLALRKVEEHWSGFGFIGRRQLLSGALRLTRNMSPEVADTLARCREVLGYTEPVEVYVKPDPMLNASCMRDGAGPVIVVLSSRLMEVFDPAELAFVVGHELGHAAFAHFGLPMPHVAKIEDAAGQIVTRPDALKLYLWSRAAEISADRAGLVCARDPEAAARGFFKMASGLASPRVLTDLEAYASQVESLAAAPEARKKPREDDDTLDCFCTHPYSPVRVRAVLAFSKSKTYAHYIGKSPQSDALTDDIVEALVERDLQLMDAGYLEEATADGGLLRRALYGAGLSVAATSGGIDPREVRALRTLLGPSDAMDATAVEQVRATLAGDLEKIRPLALSKRAQLLQHLCIVAAADGIVDDGELAELCRIASALDVPERVVHETLRGAHRPLD
jgi:tellurite resistance protein